MSEKPILFNTQMVQAIQAGRKTMTRRVIRFKMADVYDFACGLGKWNESYDPHNPPQQLVEMYVRFIGKRPCEPGDILWVRETWSTTEKCGLYPNWPTSGVHYMHKAIDPDCEPAQEARWFPSIHMPKEAARIFLRVKNVRVERLQDMTEQDADEEGCKGCPTKPAECPEFSERDRCYHDHWYCMHTLPQAFGRDIWDSTIKPADRDKYGWNANPWVWVIEFERCEKPEGWPQCR